MLALFTMTCFWDSILTSLNKDDFKILGHETKLNRVDFIQDLKNKNTLISTKWCGKELKEQEKREHFEAIKCYNINLFTLLQFENPKQKETAFVKNFRIEKV